MADDGRSGGGARRGAARRVLDQVSQALDQALHSTNVTQDDIEEAFHNKVIKVRVGRRGDMGHGSAGGVCVEPCRSERAMPCERAAVP
jgi:hypothetical protein